MFNHTQYMEHINQLEIVILNSPSSQGVDGYCPLMDDLIDLLWDTSPGALERFYKASNEFHEAYSAR